MKKNLLLLLFLCLCSPVLAQKYAVKGIVLEGETKEAAYSASVALMSTDSVSVAGATVKDDGTFQVATSKAGDYILRISYMGYNTHYQKVTLAKSTRTVDLGTITLEENNRVLKAAEVTVQAAQVEVKADTFMYNADAYRLPEGATLEELVRKLPGAEISDDGTLKINGKTVSKILVKGKEFFGNDKDMALKNLSSKMVQKIKAYDKKSDYTRITGIDDGEEETVLDLTVKKGMGEGWMLNVDLGLGNAYQDKLPGSVQSIKFPKPLYTGNINLSRFTDNLQFMLIASRNNINNGSGRWGGFGGGSGVTTTTMSGLNVTWTNGLPRGTARYLEVGGNVRYNSREAESLTLSNSETFLSSASSSFRNALSRSTNDNFNVNADLRLEWMPDSLTTILFRPSYSHSKSDNSGNSESITFDQDPYTHSSNPLADYTDDDLFDDADGNETRVNSQTSASRSNGNSNSGNMNLQVNRRLGKAGRNITLDVNGNTSKSSSDSYSWSKIKYYKQGNDRLQDRYTLSPSKSWAIQSRFSYTEPITRYLNLQLSYQYQRRFSDNNRSMYNLENLISQANNGDIIDEAMLYTIFNNGIDVQNAFAGGLDWQTISLDAANSQYATYKENNHNAQAMFRYNRKLESGSELNFNAGVSLQPQHTLMNYRKNAIDTTVTRTTVNWAPRVNLRWKISSVSQLRVHYNARMSQPSMTQLMEVMDDSNPQNISTGNAGLRSSWNNNLFMEYNGYRQESQTSWYVRGGYGNTRNSITSATIYDTNTGVSYVRPMNINGNWNTWGNINFNTAMGEKKYWNFSNSLNVNYNYRLGYLNGSNSGTPLDIRRTADGRVDMDYLFSQVDFNQFKSSTKTMGVGDNIRFNYRKSFGDNWSVDFGANSGFNYNHTSSSSQTNNNINSWTYSYGGNATIMFPWSITFTTNITEQCRRGYTDASMNTNELLWNATLQKSFLKGNAATISVEWNDILHQRSNVSRAISAYSRTDNYTNNINSYFMAHFIYRLNLMGNKDARKSGFGGPGFGGPGEGGAGRPSGGGGRGGGFGGGGFGGPR